MVTVIWGGPSTKQAGDGARGVHSRFRCHSVLRGRSLYFQAFDRLYKAFQEFLQALFVARRTYPLAYNKWIREQVADWLALPELYEELPPILSVRKIEGAELAQNADALRGLLERWT